MSLYDELQGVASEILGEYKQGKINLIQFVYPEDTPDNPGEPVEKVTPLDATSKGVSFKYLKESFITSSDKEVTSSVVANVTPSENDFLEIDGTRYKILKFDPLPSAGTACVWKFIIHVGG